MSESRIAPPGVAVNVCCTAPQAWAWVQVVAALALDGDPEGQGVLPEAVEHWLLAP